jgi:hypothetical protein
VFEWKMIGGNYQSATTAKHEHGRLQIFEKRRNSPGGRHLERSIQRLLPLPCQVLLFTATHSQFWHSAFSLVIPVDFWQKEHECVPITTAKLRLH